MKPITDRRALSEDRGQAAATAAVAAAEALHHGTVEIDAILGNGEQRSLADDVLAGLTKSFKELPPKHFYDRRGAELFDKICELPEYYPTRTERSILARCAEEIVALTGASELVELGSGTASKTRVLLDAMSAAGTLSRYVPVDVTEGLVRECAAELTREYPGLCVHGVIGDFERHLDRVPPPEGRRLVAFLGGTIGNFPPPSRLRFLSEVGGLLRPDDHLLIGADLVKDRDVLQAAYNDAEGVTAEFNRNVLHVLNRELDANFAPESFEHVAVFDDRRQWIEMRLRSKRDQTIDVRSLKLSVHFAEGEEMRTEISAKFTRKRVEDDLAAAGLQLTRWLTDANNMFTLALARPLAASSKTALQPSSE